jgi:hypothetical protein
MDEPVIAHGMPVPTVGEGRPFVGIEKLGAGTAIGGLTPALLISTEPNGIPAGDMPPGDETVAADDALLPDVASHVVGLASEDPPIPNPPPS